MARINRIDRFGPARRILVLIFAGAVAIIVIGLSIAASHREGVAREEAERQAREAERIQRNIDSFERMSHLSSIRLPVTFEELYRSAPDTVLLHKDDSVAIAMYIRAYYRGRDESLHISVVGQPSNPTENTFYLSSHSAKMYRGHSLETLYDNVGFLIHEDEIMKLEPIKIGTLTDRYVIVYDIYAPVIVDRWPNPRYGRRYQCSTDADCRTNGRVAKRDSREWLFSWRWDVVRTDSIDVLSR